jgi:hypothetical protein
VHEVEERKNSHINDLMKKHDRAFTGEPGRWQCSISNTKGSQEVPGSAELLGSVLPRSSLLAAGPELVLAGALARRLPTWS